MGHTDNVQRGIEIQDRLQTTEPRLKNSQKRGKMTQEAKVLAAKPECLSSIPRTQMVGGRTDFHKVL